MLSEHTLPRMPPDLGRQPARPRGTDRPWELSGRVPRPSTPYVGHCRREQKVAARSQSDLYLDILWANTRGYHHDSTQILPDSEARSKFVLESVIIFARGSLCKRARTGVDEKNYREIHDGINSKMASDLLFDPGFGLASL